MEDYPDTLEFEVTNDMIRASSPNHDRDNPLALALTDHLETRYHVSIHEGGAVLAQPYDDPSTELSATEKSPWYILNDPAKDFLASFHRGNYDLSNCDSIWFFARRYECAGACSH